MLGCNINLMLLTSNATPLEKSSCKKFQNLFFIVLDIACLPEKLSIWCVIPGKMSGKNEWHWPYSLWTIELKPTQLWPPQKSTFCDRSVWLRRASDGKSLGWKQRGATVSHIAQTMQMSQWTVYSILKRHRENPGDVKNQLHSGRRRTTTTAAGTFHEDAYAYYTPYYTLSSTIKIGNVIK